MSKEIKHSPVPRSSKRGSVRLYGGGLKGGEKQRGGITQNIKIKRWQRKMETKKKKQKERERRELCSSSALLPLYFIIRITALFVLSLIRNAN